jgi:hypothetical protein
MTDDTAARPAKAHGISSRAKSLADTDAPQLLLYHAPVWCICGWRADTNRRADAENDQVRSVRITYGEYTAQLLAAILHLDAAYNIVDAEVVDDVGQP